MADPVVRGERVLKGRKRGGLLGSDVDVDGGYAIGGCCIDNSANAIGQERIVNCCAAGIAVDPKA